MRGRVIAEWIGYGEDRTMRAFGQGSLRRPWVARVTPRCGKLHREFIRGDLDFERANRAGSRGVRVVWTLRPGTYETFEMLSWGASRRRFIYVDGDGTVSEVAPEDIQLWLSDS